MKVRSKVTWPSAKELQISRRAVGGLKAEDLDVGMGISQVDDKWG